VPRVHASEDQKSPRTVAAVDAYGLWPGKVVTEVSAAGPVWEAEPEPEPQHQDYLEKFPEGYTLWVPKTTSALVTAILAIVMDLAPGGAVQARRIGEGRSARMQALPS
jgi:hypothetical protein